MSRNWDKVAEAQEAVYEARRRNDGSSSGRQRVAAADRRLKEAYDEAMKCPHCGVSHKFHDRCARRR